MNISGLKGLLIVGSLLIATPQALDARTVDGNQTPQALNCCEEKGSSEKKSEAGKGSCEKKAEGCGSKAEGCSKKVSQLPGEGDEGTAGAAGGGGTGEGTGGGETGATGGTGGTTTTKKTGGTTEAGGEGGTTGEGGGEGEGTTPPAGTPGTD